MSWFVQLAVQPLLQLVMINKYDDVIFLYPVERMRKWDGGRGSKTECLLFMSVTDSTHTDIKL